MRAGLILAAGAGRRFGPDGKLLAPVEGRPLLQHALDAQTMVDELERVLVVLGARAEAVLRAIAAGHLDLGRAETTVCPDWEAGQSASLRHGLAELAGAERVLVTLADQPRITPAAIRRVLMAPATARAAYAGRPGHPVLLTGPTLAAAAHRSGDEGARGLLAGAALIECGDVGDDVDIDTP